MPAKINEVDQYIVELKDSTQREWTAELVDFMREVYPDVHESFINKMPTYEVDDCKIVFAANANHFSFFTSDTRVFSLIQELLPTTKIVKNCARIKYTEFGTEILIDVIKEIVDYHQSQKSQKVVDIKALRKWKAIPPETQKLLLQNVFCAKCGITEIVDYTFQNDRFGVVLNGKCKQCGNDVARFIEDEM